MNEFWRQTMENLRKVARSASVDVIPDVLGEIERARATLLLRLTRPRAENGTGEKRDQKPERYLTVPEVAELLRVSDKTVYRLKKRLGGVKVGGSLRFPESRVRRRLEGGRC